MEYFSKRFLGVALGCALVIGVSVALIFHRVFYEHKYAGAILQSILLLVSVLSFRLGATMQLYRGDAKLVAEIISDSSAPSPQLGEEPEPALAISEQESEKPLTTTERNTLLTIISALCVYSDIRLEERGVAGKIAVMTQENGAPVSDDSIRNVLKQIPEALATRMK